VLGSRDEADRTAVTGISFMTSTTIRISAVNIDVRSSGACTSRRIRPVPAPSARADSSSATGMRERPVWTG
jgi:hypothetical protein